MTPLQGPQGDDLCMSHDEMPSKGVLEPTDSSVVHIAAPKITIGERSRQRCSWCGESMRLPDHIGMVVPEARYLDEGSFVVTGGLVRFARRADGAEAALIGRFPDDDLPFDCCAYRDVPDTLPDLA
jgi:hypothetical protein